MMARSSNKSTVSRRARILEELETKGQVIVSELSKEFKISEVTIRNDLTQLEKQNMLIRARGGAIKMKYYRMGIDPSISDKQKEYLKEKQHIAKAALKYIEDGDTIVLDSGTTTTEIDASVSEKHFVSIKSHLCHGAVKYCAPVYIHPNWAAIYRF